jgi:3-hydroxybutyryl-CoA dehydrogenase
MSNILVIGDGPLADEIIALCDGDKHTAVGYLFDQDRRSVNPLGRLPDFLREMADTVDVVVEAVIGSREDKRAVIRALSDAFVGTSEPILTAVHNASATEVGSWCAQPENVIGWAALPPLADAKVIEMLPGANTAPETIKAAEALLTSFGKAPVMVEDTLGGVLPRIVANLANEAAFALTEQVASAEDIDQAMKLGTNYPHGPLEWADVIGLDQVVGIITALGEVYGTDRYRPAPMLRQLALAGHWGRRTGRGFYTYEAS